MNLTVNSLSISIFGEWLVISNPVFLKISKAETNGTGLNNLRHRFELLTGKSIEVCETDNLFTVESPL